MESFIHGIGATKSLDFFQIVASFTTTLVLVSLIAAVYRWTHVGVSYSRSFVQTIVLSGIVSAIMIIAVGNNLARGLGILGALAIIRFRTPIRNPRDIVFIFASLAVGISIGSQLYMVGIVGTVAYVLTVLLLNASFYSTKKCFEGLLRFSVPVGTSLEDVIPKILGEFTSNVEVLAIRDSSQGERTEYAYQIRLKHPTLRGELLQEIGKIAGIGEVNLVMQRESVEI